MVADHDSRKFYVWMCFVHACNIAQHTFLLQSVLRKDTDSYHSVRQ